MATSTANLRTLSLDRNMSFISIFSNKKLFVPPFLSLSANPNAKSRFIVLSASLDAKPTVLVAKNLKEVRLMLLKEFATVDCSNDISPEELCTKISLCITLIVRSGTKLNREVFESSCGRLKVIGGAGVGIDNVDTANTVAATEHRIQLE